MGFYTEYLGKNLNFKGIEAERKKQLLEISKHRGGRDIIVYAADLTKSNANIDYTDILPFQDQLANLTGDAIDVIIETPGGFAEAVEDMVTMLRTKYKDKEVGIIVPGWAKSAGTILAMAGDEILMGTASALGPIDAQIGQTNGKRFSAHAFLEGFKKIKEEIAANGKLNPAYIPILQNISPGEIQQAENAQAFSEKLVTEWLENYKFKNWTTRRTSGEAVTPAYKKQRAAEIATQLSDQSRWLTHGRSIRIAELEQLNLRITDYSKIPALNEAITRYYTLLRMTFETNLAKIYETPKSQVYRYGGAQGVPPPKNQAQAAKSVGIRFNCGKCRTPIPIQVNFEKDIPIKTNLLPFPANNIVKCPSCNADNDVSVVRLQLEAQTGKKVITQ